MTINRSTKPDDIVETTQKIRLKIIEQLLGAEGKPSTDPKELAALNQTLRDMDTTALNVRKIDVEEKGVNVASQIAANLAQVYKELGNANPFERNMGKVERADMAERLPPIKTVPGHTRQGVEELRYEDFVEK